MIPQLVQNTSNQIQLLSTGHAVQVDPVSLLAPSPPRRKVILPDLNMSPALDARYMTMRVEDLAVLRG